MIRVPVAERGLAAAEGWQRSAARYEIKFIGPAHAAAAAASRLAGLCRPDAEFPGNVVHSVYFDTARLRAYREKSDGDYRKVKLRLRWYAARYRTPAVEGPWTAWLEIKVRDGSRGFKHRKPLRLNGPSPMAGLPPDRLAALVHAELGSPLRPTCWLAYTRTRLVGPDGETRVSVDRDIRVLWTAPWLPVRPVAPELPVFLVEVKGARPVPHPVLATAVARHARKRSISKYALCLEHAGGAS